MIVGTVATASSKVGWVSAVSILKRITENVYNPSTMS